MQIQEPYQNQQILQDDSLTVTYLIGNAGPDTILKGDTLGFVDPVSGSIDSSTGIARPRSRTFNGNLKAYESIPFSVTYTAAQVKELGQLSEWCVQIFLVNRDSTGIIESTPNNNRVCNTVNIVTNIGSVNSNIDLKQIITSPNPAFSFANIGYGLQVNDKLSIRMVDNLGKLVLWQNMGYQIKGKYNIPIDVSALSNGLYFVEIVGECSRLTGKIVVQR